MVFQISEALQVNSSSMPSVLHLLRGTYPTQTPPSAAASILVIHDWEAVSSPLYDLSPALEAFQASSLSPTIPHGSLRYLS